MKSVVKRSLRRGFTLVELTVVILIIGIVATIAAPKFFQSVNTARDKSANQSLEVVRNAIDLYQANNRVFPGLDDNQVTLKADLSTFLRKEFPTCQAGKNNANVKFSGASPLVATTDPEAWIYNKTTGEVRINDPAYITY